LRGAEDEGKNMTSNEKYLYVLSTRIEFEQLCRKIVHDGRDPVMVAHGMVERLAEHLRELIFLVSSMKEENI